MTKQLLNVHFKYSKRETVINGKLLKFSYTYPWNKSQSITIHPKLFQSTQLFKYFRLFGQNQKNSINLHDYLYLAEKAQELLRYSLIKTLKERGEGSTTRGVLLYSTIVTTGKTKFHKGRNICESSGLPNWVKYLHS